MQVRFKNGPRLSGREGDKKYDDRRVALVARLPQFIESHPLFDGDEAIVEYAHTGVSSLVCFITTSKGRYVLKIPLAVPVTEGEARFLKAWEKAGATVPHVFDEGMLGEHAYLIMEYVDARLLSEIAKEKRMSDIYEHMGRLMRVMHGARGEGFGHIKEGRPKFASFKEWIDSDDVWRRVREVQSYGIVGEKYGSIERAREILLKHHEQHHLSVYCHFDFGKSNLLATDPPTVIDPFPLMCDPMIDVGRTAHLISMGSASAADLFTKGYFGNDDVDPSVLAASILLSAYLKFHFWHKVGKTEAIEQTKVYLAMAVQPLLS
jgi:aminoglycoside phosphotransferase (APT) family kinase protein